MTDINDVLSKWASEFGSLFDSTEQEVETLLNLNLMKQLNKELQHSSSHSRHQEFDRDFSISEVRKIDLKSKDKKAPGLDGPVNEVLKNDICIKVLTGLFNMCFDTGVLPTQWLQAIINAIPENSNSDP